MRLLGLVFGIAGVFAGAFASASDVADRIPKVTSGWEKVSDEGGVFTYRKEVEGSDVVAFRGESVIDAPIAKVANILIDTSRKKDWVHKLVEAKDIRNVNAFERVEYNHTASGFFFVRDRDFVFHAKAELDRTKHQMTISLQSVEDELMPEGGPVRGYLDDSRYILTELAPGKTHIVIEIHADPKGNVPSWLVNTFQKSWPRKTLEGIRKQASRTDIAEHQATKTYFQSATLQMRADGKLLETSLQ